MAKTYYWKMLVLLAIALYMLSKFDFKKYCIQNYGQFSLAPMQFSMKFSQLPYFDNSKILQTNNADRKSLPKHRLSEKQKLAITSARNNITRSLEKYHVDRNILMNTPENGGNPSRCYLAATWRSGSNFLGEVLSTHPAIFYHHDPLDSFGMQQIRSGKLADKAAQLVKQLLKCNFSDEKFVQFGHKMHSVWKHTPQLVSTCEVLGIKSCITEPYLSAVCNLFPIQVIKIVNLRGNYFEEFLADKSFNIKMILLIRDPRGIMESRKHFQKHCRKNKDCYESSVLCSDQIHDYRVAKKLLSVYPDRFMVVRYEDITVNVTESVHKLFNFCGIHKTKLIEDYISAHTAYSKGNIYSTYRNSKENSIKWRNELDFSEIVNIQKSCEEALDLWGYRKLVDKRDQYTFNPINNITLLP